MDMDAEQLIQILEDAGLDVRTDYSGRGMHGRTCVGAVTDDDFTTVLADIVANCEDCEQAAELIRTANTDSMGRGTIVYWPRVRTEDDRETA